MLLCWNAEGVLTQNKVGCSNPTISNQFFVGTSNHRSLFAGHFLLLVHCWHFCSSVLSFNCLRRNLTDIKFFC